MTHASAIIHNMEHYRKKAAGQNNWDNYLQTLSSGKTLFGRLCLSQNARFMLAVFLAPNDCMFVRFWREDPNDIGYCLNSCEHFQMSLGYALDAFPELKDVILYDDIGEGWARKK